jgi:excisionase family DNA binding protein
MEPRHTSADEELLPIGTAARLLGVSVDTVRRWADDGKIKGQRTAGGQRRFPRSEIDRLLGVEVDG